MPIISSQLVMRPVRPNSTTSANATTNGGDDGQHRHQLHQARVTPAATLHHQRKREAEQRRQHADDRREQRRVDRDAASRAPAEAAQSPDVLGPQALPDELRREMALRVLERGDERTADRIEDEEQQQHANRDDDRRDRRVAGEQAQATEGAREADGEGCERDDRADAERRAVHAGIEALRERPCKSDTGENRGEARHAEPRRRERENGGNHDGCERRDGRVLRPLRGVADDERDRARAAAHRPRQKRQRRQCERGEERRGQIAWGSACAWCRQARRGDGCCHRFTSGSEQKARFLL